MEGHVIDNVRFLDATWIAESIRCHQQPLLLDSRPSAEYNSSHIVRALNVGGSHDLRTKIQQNDFPIDTLSDVLGDARLGLTKMQSMPVVVYDDCSDDLTLLQSDSFLYLLLARLSTIIKPVFMLKGGFLHFQSVYPALCWKCIQTYSNVIDPHLLSDNLLDADASNQFYNSDKSSELYLQAPPSIIVTSSQSATLIEHMKPSLILPHLIVGSQSNAMSLQMCQRYGITHVINVSVQGDKSPHVSASRFHRIPINDNFTDQFRPYADAALAFIDQAKRDHGHVLIHCSAGISRSPTLAIAYLMKSANMSLRKAYAMVKSIRPAIAPNFNFLGQLSEFECELNHNTPLSDTLIAATTTCLSNTVSECIAPPASSTESPRRLSISAGGKRSASYIPPVLSSLSPKHSQGKKRDRPTYLSLDTPRSGTRLSNSKHRSMHHYHQSSSQNVVQQKSDSTPTEGKRTCFQIGSSTSCSSLLPSPCTVFSCLELTSSCDRPSNLPIRSISSCTSDLPKNMQSQSLPDTPVKHCTMQPNVAAFGLLSNHPIESREQKRSRRLSAPSTPLSSPVHLAISTDRKYSRPINFMSHLPTTASMCRIRKPVPSISSCKSPTNSTILRSLTPNSCTELYISGFRREDLSSSSPSVAFISPMRSSVSADDSLLWYYDASSKQHQVGSSSFVIPRLESSCRLEQQQHELLHRSSSSSMSSGCGGMSENLSSSLTSHSSANPTCSSFPIS